MGLLILFAMVLFGLVSGLGKLMPSNKAMLIVRLAPIALFFLWAPANSLGLIAAALLTTAAYALGRNIGTGAPNLLVDQEPLIGAWITEKYGKRASMFWMAGAIIIGTLLYLIA